MNIEEKLKELNIELPTAVNPQASYISCVTVGNLVYVSGQGTMFNGERKYCGRVGREVSPEDAYKAARICGLNVLAQLNHYLGSLDKIKKVVNLRGFVNSDLEFFAQPAVINGASDLMVEVFGDDIGKHTRTAIGVCCLPNNISVEVDVIVEI